MGNLLIPAWFNPWGWTALALVVVILLVVIIVLIVVKGKRGKGGNESSLNEGENKEEKAKRAASSTKTYHITKRKKDGKWQVKAAGAEKAIKLFDTQAEAIDYAKTVAGNQEANIMIHKTDGSFRKLDY